VKLAKSLIVIPMLSTPSEILSQDFIRLSYIFLIHKTYLLHMALIDKIDFIYIR